MAEISLVSTSKNTITVKVTGLDGTYTGSDRYVIFRFNGTPVSDKVSVGAKKDYSGSYTYKNLKPNTDYSSKIEAYVYWNNGSNNRIVLPDSSDDFVTDKETQEPEEPEEPDEPTGDELDYFYWRTKSKKYFESGDEVSLVTASKWKKLVGLIEDLIDLTDEDPWYTKSSNTGKTYLSATKCKNVSSGSEIKAEIYDSVRFQLAARSIADMDDPGSVKSKDPIYPEHFNSLQDAINNWIDEYNNSL